MRIFSKSQPQAFPKNQPYPTLTQEPICTHCHTPLQAGDPAPFCCRGCEAVYCILQEKGLSEFYTLRDQLASGTRDRRTGGGPPTSPSLIPSLAASSDAAYEKRYAYLDDPDFTATYSLPCAEAPGERTMEFYLEGVHCAACVWLTEKLPQLAPGVETVRLSLANSVATVRLKPEGRFSEAAEEFAKLGYRPHPIRQGSAHTLQLQEDRSLLIRVAIAGACAGNIMLLAVAIYAGAEGTLAAIFKWVSLILFLPIAFYSAKPFYSSAWRALKAKQLSIDIPIVAGLGLGFLMSFYQLARGTDLIYFDSLGSLVFLLLCTRYLLRRAQRSTLTSYELLYHLIPSWVMCRSEQEKDFRQVRTEQVKIGDFVRVKAGQNIPLDGIVHEGESSLNIALLTGEPSPQVVRPGSLVYAGTVNLHAPLEVRIAASGSQSRLGKILTSVEQNLAEKASIVTFTDRVSKWFVLATFILATLAFALGLFQGSASGNGITEALSRFLALVIVMCPCSFALATPLALSSAIKRCAQNGILIKSAAAIEKLGHVDTVFFDKTGTLTSGEFRVLEWQTTLSPENAAKIVLALESRSNHPIAHALVNYFKPLGAPEQEPRPEVKDFREVLGIGVSGQIGNHRYEMRALNDQEPNLEPIETETKIALYEDGTQIGIAKLGDRIRMDSRLGIARTQALGMKTGLLSGDSLTPALAIALQAGIPAAEVRAGLTPEGKNNYLKGFPYAAMVGDGANDAPALAGSYLGIAVQGGVEVSMKAADIYCTRPGVFPIHELLILGQETLKVIHRNFIFSIVYNAIGVGAAFMGWVTPLFAAILMPISAFTVFLSAIYGTRKMRSLFKHNQYNKSEKTSGLLPANEVRSLN